MIRIDPGVREVLVVCDECPGYYDWAGDRAGAIRRACEHEESVHPDEYVVRQRRATSERTRRYRGECSTM